MGPLGLIWGATYLLPYKAIKFEYATPGSSGKMSALPLSAAEHSDCPDAQWIAIPIKSADAKFGLALNSAASGEFAPNTSGMSALASSTRLSVATAPTLHPARVYGTQGAGVLLPAAVSTLKLVSVGIEVLGSNRWEVQ